MNTTQRLEQALRKIYDAFQNDTLHPECCKTCAVGNILNGDDSWRHLSDYHGSLQLNYVGLVHERIGRRFAGYTPSELLQIEAAFLRGCGYQLPLQFNHFKPENAVDKAILFDGVCAAVQKICALDDVDGTMDISFLLKTIRPLPHTNTSQIQTHVQYNERL